MICPQCKAEYRPGFTICADCDVPLVTSLPQTDSNSIPSGTLVPLWEGEDIALHTSLLEELDAAGIRHFSQPMATSPGVRRGVPFPIQAMVRFGYQVAVLSSDFASAERILEKLLDDEPKDMTLPADDGASADTQETLPRGDEEATCEVWTGAREELSDFLLDALRENNVQIRTNDSGGKITIYVRPSDNTRAREIIREITEASPPM